jgi:predicted nucleic acid-binding protein
MTLVLLDNEAVQALADPQHPKHRRMLSHLQTVADRKRRTEISAAVPTSVRVEAGWDRTASRSAFLNRLLIRDVTLDKDHANIAAAIRDETGVSVADAHLGAVIRSARAAVAVVSSDPADMRAVAGPARVTIITI